MSSPLPSPLASPAPEAAAVSKKSPARSKSTRVTKSSATKKATSTKKPATVKKPIVKKPASKPVSKSAAVEHPSWKDIIKVHMVDTIRPSLINRATGGYYSASRRCPHRRLAQCDQEGRSRCFWPAFISLM
jgi:hypothetical protein